MSNKVEQALCEYQDAVARSVASQEAQQGSEPQEEREKSSGAYQALRGAYHSDDVRMAWERYLGAWAEEGTGEWWEPWGGTNV